MDLQRSPVGGLTSRGFAPGCTRVLRDKLENVVHTVTTRRGFRRAEEDAAEGHQPDVSPVQSASTGVFRGYLISDQGNRIEIIGGSTAEQVSDRLRRICSNPGSIDIFTKKAVREGETFENLKEAVGASTSPAFQTSGNEVVLGEIPETNGSAKGGTQTRSVSAVLKPQPHLGKEPTVETQGVLRPKEKGSQWQAPLDAVYGASPKQPEDALQEQAHELHEVEMAWTAKATAKIVDEESVLDRSTAKPDSSQRASIPSYQENSRQALSPPAHGSTLALNSMDLHHGDRHGIYEHHETIVEGLKAFPESTIGSTHEPLPLGKSRDAEEFHEELSVLESALLRSRVVDDDGSNKPETAEDIEILDPKAIRDELSAGFFDQHWETDDSPCLNCRKPAESLGAILGKGINSISISSVAKQMATICEEECPYLFNPCNAEFVLDLLTENSDYVVQDYIVHSAESWKSIFGRDVCELAYNILKRHEKALNLFQLAHEIGLSEGRYASILNENLKAALDTDDRIHLSPSGDYEILENERQPLTVSARDTDEAPRSRKSIDPFVFSTFELMLEALLLSCTKESPLTSKRDVNIMLGRVGAIDGQVQTLEKLGTKHELTKERVRQIEKRVSKDLRHPARISRLSDFWRAVVEIIHSKGGEVAFSDLGLELKEYFQWQDSPHVNPLLFILRLNPQLLLRESEGFLYHMSPKCPVCLKMQNFLGETAPHSGDKQSLVPSFPHDKKETPLTKTMGALAPARTASAVAQTYAEDLNGNQPDHFRTSLFEEIRVLLSTHNRPMTEKEILTYLRGKHSSEEVCTTLAKQEEFEEIEEGCYALVGWQTDLDTDELMAHLPETLRSFLLYLTTKNNSSYKLVLASIFLKEMDDSGRVPLSRLRNEMYAYYKARKDCGLIIEAEGLTATRIDRIEPIEFQHKVLRHPLGSFLNSEYFSVSEKCLWLSAEIQKEITIHNLLGCVLSALETSLECYFDLISGSARHGLTLATDSGWEEKETSLNSCQEVIEPRRCSDDRNKDADLIQTSIAIKRKRRSKIQL